MKVESLSNRKINRLKIIPFWILRTFFVQFQLVTECRFGNLDEDISNIYETREGKRCFNTDNYINLNLYV